MSLTFLRDYRKSGTGERRPAPPSIRAPDENPDEQTYVDAPEPPR
jgi:hypothetical protein